MDIVSSSVLSLVPNWYISECGPFEFILDLKSEKVTFRALRNLTPQQWELKRNAECSAEHLVEISKDYPRAIAVDLIQEYLAIKWLQILSPSVNWNKALSYFRELADRTYENSPISKSILVSPSEGMFDVTESRYNKIIDMLGSTSYVYLKVDREFRFLDICEIRWSDVKDTNDYKFHPEFLHPYVSAIGDKEFLIYKNVRHDTIIAAKYGIVATKRKGRWKLYDPNTLKNSIVDILGTSYRIGCNIYEVLFDLSFRRRGALLIYDPLLKMKDVIINPHSQLLQEEMDSISAHSIVRESIRKIDMSSWGESNKRNKRIFLELASIDGAVIYTDKHIVAFGAMIKTHDDITDQYGARSTAALSAYAYGAYPIKISADGDVTIFFESRSKNGKACRAELHFA